MTTNTQLIAVDSKFLITYCNQQLSLYRRDHLTVEIASGNVGELQPNADFTFLLAAPPLNSVEVVLSKTAANLVVLVGRCEISLVRLPQWISSSHKTISDDRNSQICRCESVDRSSFGRSVGGKLKILKVAWHPGAEKPPVLTVLTNDNSIRLYNMDAPDRCLQRISFDRSDPNATGLSSTIRSGLGESPVSFDYGIPNVCGPLKRVKESASLWPLFVLYGNGDVYSVLTNPKNFRSYPISGPLSMYPPADDNYGVDASSILFLNSAVPLIIVATAYGIQYNCVLLSAEEDSNENDFTLHVYDSVGLELTLSTWCPNTNQLTEDTFSSPCWLQKDAHSTSRYYCCHNAGIHAVTMPWVFDLKKAGETDDYDTATNQHTSIEHVLCTKPLPNSAVKTTLGMALLSTGFNQTRTVVTLAQNGQMEFQEISLSSRYSDGWTDSPAISTLKRLEEPVESRQFYIDHVKELLHKTVTNPILKSGATDVPPKECLQLLTRCTQVLRSEYIDKLMLAKIDSDERVSALRKLKESQLEHTAKYEKLLTVSQNQLERLKQKQLQMSEQQLFLCERLENIIAKQRSSDIVPSEAEEAALQELEMLNSLINTVQLKIKKLDAYVKQLSAESTAGDLQKLSKDQQATIERLLERQSAKIEQLVAQVTSLGAAV